MKRVVILCDGDFPRQERVLRYFKEASDVVCCDAAVLKLTEYYGSENLDSLPYKVHIVGDMDSLDEYHKRLYSSRVHRVPEQESNDQTKAFHYALTLQPQSITILGASGRRDDHTIANASLLADYAEYAEMLRESGRPAPEEIKAVNDYGTFIPILDSATMECEPGCEVSIFAFDPTLRIKSKGLQYPVDDTVFDIWWRATLNIALSDTFSLEMNHKSKALLFISAERR